MARGSNLERIQRLRAAQKRAKADDMMTLTELQHLWGSSKGAFVNTRNKMAEFPEPQQGNANQLIYPAAPAIKAMLEHETREDAAEQERRERAMAIMGGQTKGRKKKDEVYLPPSELLKYSRLQAEIEERERNQGAYIPISDVSGTAARIYAIISDHLGQLETRVDPNGLLPSETRVKLGELGRSAQLAIHKELSDMLGSDVDDHASRPPQRRKAPRRPRRTRA